MRITFSLFFVTTALAISACDAGNNSGPGGSGGSSSSGDVTSSSSSGSSSGMAGAGGAGGSVDLPGWKLVWNDEFNGPDGSDVDPTKWVHAESGNGNGNQERQYYTSGKDNAFQAGGNLHIVAQKLPQDGGGFTCWYGPCWYTSGKLVTKDWNKPSLFEKTFGRYSARIKIPAGQGIWPAFWMLGNNIEQVNWPVCGEIDTMENIGKEPNTVHGTIHGPDANNQHTSDGGNKMTMGALADDFHIYTVEWKQGEIRFLLDDVEYFKTTPANFPGTWVFDDHPYYLLLNLAIGGTWPGDPDAATQFPAEMLVDWVRVYDPM